MSKAALVIIFSLAALAVFGQKSDSLTSFYYPNGQVSSTGMLVDGKPDGYWRTFFENGQLKSEGNRKNFQLDSTWIFYDENGNKTLEIHYKNGLKDGLRITYLTGERLEENFRNDIKDGLTRRYDAKNRLLQQIPFTDGLEDGLAISYDTTGNINELLTYQKGYIVDRERINRYDSDNRRHGPWKWFYENGLIKTEGNYKHGLKNGFFKEYSADGNLKSIVKFVDGVKQEQAEELAKLELKRDFYPDGKIKIEATYRNGVAEGIRREFDSLGNVEKSYIFKNGIIVGQGIIAANGQRQGLWKEYYANGKLKAQGAYLNDLRNGEWEFYYANGSIEQKGEYNDAGKPVGKWLWYYSNGALLREENFRNGLLDGVTTEYDLDGKIITQGDYIEGLEEGFWFYQTGDMRMEGEYSAGMRNGTWKYLYNNGQLAFEGKFIDDNPNGEHVYYYPDGTVREKGAYVMGRKNGDWRRYLEDGTLVITINYSNGIERKYDGISIPEDELVIPD